ncbi:hypothetical protein J2848_005225 [Azospirillum lipoferum]|uniref:Uncharacterized protein n=1 Tax=Azospirillum lipoferum TaxID=193 RepID=A0A5A9GFM7_AZOLI|nr:MULTISPECIES: hypothetical protein [Azospirillum]KAA0593127.1 hypothetical protein FZ942_24620 [Azospirillum lipoferum]MCP1613529.1 hypothetical protein [Azospirillum lipoferum]MDW5532298.1 hypothetical protein [Azospirillum sp. NL1]
MDSTSDQTGMPLRDLQELILLIAGADAEQAKAMDADPTITGLLSRLFRLAARASRGTSEHRWSVDDQHPGFLISTVGGGTMAVPFHLIGDLPSGELLDDIRAIAADLRVGAGSALCLSGSIVLLGNPHYAGDLDFCEYIPLSEHDPSLVRLTEIATRTGAPPVCVTIKLGSAGRLDRPWTDVIAPEKLDALLGPCTKGGTGKIDVLAMKATIGPVEATNVMLWVPDSTPDDYAAEFSFPFQEMIPGSSADMPWMPRLLARPSSIRAYVAFLRSEIGKYRYEKPVKALKRALSLSIFLMLHEHQDRLTDLGSTSSAFVLEAIHQRQDLIARVTDHPAADVAALADVFTDALATWKAGADPSRHKTPTESFSRDVGTLIDDLLGAIDVLRAGGVG